MPTRVAFRAAARSGAIDLVQAYLADASLAGFQVYPARPRTIHPPTVFIDRITEDLTDYAGVIRQREPSVELLIVHGLFDSADAVRQGDTFVDGFLDWIADNYHGFGANTLVSVSRTADVPNYVPDWIETQTAYYATQLTLEGFAAT